MRMTFWFFFKRLDLRIDFCINAGYKYYIEFVKTASVA